MPEMLNQSNLSAFTITQAHLMETDEVLQKVLEFVNKNNRQLISLQPHHVQF